MHIGWTVLLDGPPPELGELRSHVVGRLELLPRFRKRVLFSRLGFHDAVWTDDPRFDVAEHVHRIALPAPGATQQLRELTGSLLSIPLDRRRPLWRVHLVTGLADGGWALVGQIHHALVDGIAAVEMAQLLVDGEPGAAAILPIRRWSPTPAPGFLARTVDTAGMRLRAATQTGTRAARVLSDPSGVREAIGELRRLGSALSSIGNAAPATILNQQIDAQRAVAHVALPLEAATRVALLARSTVADVVMATSALALGRHVRRSGESPPWLRALVPVGTGGGRRRGNQLSAMFVELPVGERDESSVLEEISRQTRDCNEAGAPGIFEALIRAGAALPGPVRDALSWVLARPQTFNTVISTIRGPSGALYLLGRRVRAAYPAVPLAQGHGMSIGALSYCGVLHIGIYACPRVFPGVVELGDDVRIAFDALSAAVAPRPSRPTRPSPGGRRSAAREHALT